MAFLLQGLRKFAGRPKRKYSQGREKRNLTLDDVTVRIFSSTTSYADKSYAMTANIGSILVGRYIKNPKMSPACVIISRR